MSANILIVDDDPVQRRLLDAAVARLGHVAHPMPGGNPALAALSSGKVTYDAVLLDLMMPDIDGLAVMRAMRDRDINIPVLVLTAQGGIDVVISAMRAGAFDFLVKPVSPERLAGALSDALAVSKKQPQASPAIRREQSAAVPMIAESEAMDRVKMLIGKAAASDIPVLIEGESGVGKELIARAIQAGSARRRKPFVVVNCGAIPENLIESILFGHEKGAFTGATEKHAGKFVEANGGTLFLDEIGELPLAAQVKLLRAIQEGEVEPVGAKSLKKVDIRIISATNRDLIARIREGRFREDLFYRLNVFPILVPALRQRASDVPLLVQHFISAFRSGEASPTARRISPEALKLLSSHDWPGNVRQLQNAVFRAMVLCDGDTLGTADFRQIAAQVHGIDSAELMAEDDEAAASRQDIEAPGLVPAGDPTGGSWVASSDDGPGLDILDDTGNVRTLAELECDAIIFAIEHYKGQMSEVARRLGIGRSTLYRKLKEYDLGPIGVSTG
ncbi:sigma-54-dependent transcriptional regulator [Oricola cellulosilytica]|uniref:DNA-binding transcriptional regulator NtrC n=1 Tax=Oricola cellulosilytica TaxID=1429082 RepID=A0A4V2MN57_9HYPH|nr:sigma-54 dependent transcriptional regulator [Oricola cellulosilytica]TCD11457.1 sigma-54-dependent Fis family transcriptional regulator [Oricola cellulosilytica]